MGRLVLEVLESFLNLVERWIDALSLRDLVVTSGIGFVLFCSTGHLRLPPPTTRSSTFSFPEGEHYLSLTFWGFSFGTLNLPNASSAARA